MTRHVEKAGAAGLLKAGPDPVALRSIVARPGPCAWLYATINNSVVGRVEQIRTLGGELARQGASLAARDAVLNELSVRPLAPGMLAVIADSAGDLLLVRHLRDASFLDRAGWSEPAHIVPVLAGDQRRPPWVHAVVDRAGADLTSSPGANAPISNSTVVGSDDQIEHNSPGGWSQSRFQRRGEDSWMHNAAQIAAAIDDEVGRVHAQVLVLSGDERMLRLVRQYLTVTDVMVDTLSGSRSPDGTQALRAERRDEVIARAAAKQDECIVGELREGLGPHALAVDGLDDTLGALDQGRVAMLVVAASLDRPLAAADVVDSAVRSALLADARVRIVSTNKLRDGIGALCRYQD